MTLSEKVRRLERENEELKEENERIKQEYGDDYKPKKCQECKHFHQHYVKVGMCYLKVNEGHCTAGVRTRKKRNEDDRCQFFESER